MKKENKIIIALLAIVVVLCVVFYGYQALQPKKSIVVKHNNEVVMRFELNKDGIYQVKGDVGIVNIEVRDGRFHVFDVECPNHDCENMGWADENSILPITCLPNGIVVKME